MFLGKLVTRGRLHLILPDGRKETFGPGGAEEVTVRLHDNRVALEIARDPKLAFGEAYMDGRLTIERGDISQRRSNEISYPAPLSESPFERCATIEMLVESLPPPLEPSPQGERR